MDLLTDGNLFSFFYDRVGAAKKALGAEVEEHTEFYLVHLLVDFQRNERLVAPEGSRVDDRPLAIRLLQSQHERGRDRFATLKHLADSTLYVLGFFAESLRRSTVDLRYYAGVGESAYDGLARMTDARAHARSDVFRDLSDRFADCVEILMEVRDEGRPEADLLGLYEQCLALGDERALRRLRGLGILPLPEGGGTLH